MCSYSFSDWCIFELLMLGLLAWFFMFSVYGLQLEAATLFKDGSVSYPNK